MRLGIVERARGDLDRAQACYERALAIYHVKAPRSGEEALALNNLANIHYSKGELDEAQKLLELALAIKEEIDPNSPEIARALTNLGVVAYERSDLDAAQKFHARALAIREKQAPGSMAVAGSLINLGNISMDRGDFLDARRRYESALEICEKQDPKSPTTAIAVTNLGVLAQKRGDMPEAQRRFRAALEIQKQIGGLVNLAQVAYSRGDLAQAKALFTDVLAEERQRSPSSVMVATTLGNLADIALRQSDFKEAQRLNLEALAVWQKISPDSMNVSSTLHCLGDVAQRQGHLEEAQARHEAALAIRQRLAPGAGTTAVSHALVGNIAYTRGNSAEAARQYELALSIQEKLAPISLSVTAMVHELGVLAKAQGNEARLAQLWDQRLNLASQLLVSQATNGDLRAFGDLANDALSKLAWLTNPASQYEWLPTLRGAGLVLEARQAEASRLAQSDPSIATAMSALMVAKKAELDWLAKSPQADAKLLDLRSRRQSAENELNRLLRARDPRMSADLKVTTSQVQAAIPKDSVLLEFLRVDTWNGPQKMAVFVVSPAGPVRFLILSDAAKIDAMVADVQEYMALLDTGAPPTPADEKGLDRTLGSLYATLIEPIGVLPDSLFIAPDSSLHSLPFSALLDTHGKALVETKRISLVGSGRDLLDSPISGASAASAVLAGPAFGGPTNTWAPLPGASREGTIAGQSLGVQPLLNQQASEEALMKLNRPRVLHIATHGFYFPAPQGTYSGIALLESMSQRLAMSDTPMMRSGIVLAGANGQSEAGSQGAADGWVTALELAQLDMRGTELVALSGCETGRGDTAGAEGVFGMQRAIRFAGAQTLIMSLFRVPDGASQALFTEFYAKWHPGLPPGSKLEAFRDAQLKLLRDPKTKHPKNWAGFALLGSR